MRKVLSEAGQSAGGGFAMSAPVGGWNARDSLTKMPAKDAVYLDNWFPGTTAVDVRPGKESNATLPVAEVIQTLLNCAKQDGTAMRFAVSAAGVWDIKTTSTPASVDYALTNGKVQYININIAGEPWLWACNGVDASFAYKSSTDTFVTLSAVSVPALTGITSSDVTNVSLWKYRIILTKKNSLSFFYLPLNSVGGAATEFALGPIFKHGGYLVATANWSVDAGDGPDDRFVAITSEGEVAVYQGTDPAAISTFSLVGVYFIGKPVGKRCIVQISGDLAILTEQGLWPLSKALLDATIDRKTSLTDKITNAFNAYYKDYGTRFGWQPILYPKGPALLVNIPITDLVSYQFVMNTITGAWCRFIGWPATCLMISEGELYLANGNKVYHAWHGTSDNGAAIVAVAKQAFTYGPTTMRLKHIKLVRPILTADKTINVQMGLDTDFENHRTISSQTNLLQNAALWDSAIFDQAIWSAGTLTQGQWKTVAHKPGKAWALRLRCSVKDIAVSWPAVDYIAETGGLLT